MSCTPSVDTLASSCASYLITNDILVAWYIHTDARPDAEVVVALVSPAIIDDGNDEGRFNSLTGKSQNLCRHDGQGVSPPSIFLAK
jgi:hypothetical protein